MQNILINLLNINFSMHFKSGIGLQGRVGLLA